MFWHLKFKLRGAAAGDQKSCRNMSRRSNHQNSVWAAMRTGNLISMT